MPVKWKDTEPAIDAGALRELITFLNPTTELGVSGEATTWAPGSPPDVAFAEIQPVRGADIIKGGQDVSKMWCTVTIRYRAPGRQANQRLQDSSGNVYVIQAVENLLPGLKKYQQLTCELIGINN
jgi:head-tail adaptor